ncbi:MAG: crotonase/enoyl-CoA hydratase family protein [Candidatus Heimdallarchaeota archaeon]|nr:MAG: crotonase/enoyl-CoA hydratase family protein [Candidatus Heimdallarchaeota archaeon]
MGIRIEKRSLLWTIILDNPEVKNAVDNSTAAALADAFRDFETDEGARVSILWGDHGCFCSGANLKAIHNGFGNRLEKTGDGPMGPTRMMLSKPVIAAIAGYAVAGGLELALWCDLRVVEEDAIFGVFNRRWGVPLIDGGTVRLPRLIGMSRALDMILTGRPVTAKEAFEIGLANRIVKKGESKKEAEKLAKTIAEFPQICLQEDRMSVYEQFDYDLGKSLRNEFSHGLISLQRAGEGIKRFIEGEGRHGKF